MATLADIRSAVSRKIQDPDNTGVSASVVNSEINRSIRFYSNYRFWFNEGLANITLTAGSNVLPSVPAANMVELSVNGLMLIDNQVKITLQKLHPDEFFARDQDQTGRPAYYTYRNDQYLLLPVPDIAYPLVYRYLSQPAVLVSDSDTNAFTIYAEDLIMLHTVKNIYAEDKQDPQSAEYYSVLEKQQLNSLLERSDSRLGSGYLASETILDYTSTYYV